MDRLNRSLSVDMRLWREDIFGSQAWATALSKAAVISADEADELRSGLDRVGERLTGWSAKDGSSIFSWSRRSWTRP